jgi:D-sedoheptulose 7-phosphate isomerase
MMINTTLKENSLTEEISTLQPRQHINTYLGGLTEALGSISPAEVAQVVDLLLEAGERGSMIFVCGNGGSASTASHMACDLAKGARVAGFPPFRAIALTDSLPQLTAWANDTSYDNCFAGQLEGLGRPGDLLIAISGSGNSPNVLNAVEVARNLGMNTVGFAGFNGGKLKDLVDYALVIPASNIEQVEDVHLVLEHTICITLRYTLQERTTLLAKTAS